MIEGEDDSANSTDGYLSDEDNTYVIITLVFAVATLTQ